MRRKIQMEVGERLVKLRIRAFHPADQLVGLHVVGHRERGPGGLQSRAMFRVFEVFRPRPRPQRRIVQRDRLERHCAKDLRSKSSIAYRQRRAEVPRIVRSRCRVDHLQCLPRTRLLLDLCLDAGRQLLLTNRERGCKPAQQCNPQNVHSEHNLSLAAHRILKGNRL